VSFPGPAWLLTITRRSMNGGLKMWNQPRLPSRRCPPASEPLYQADRLLSFHFQPSCNNHVYISLSVTPILSLLHLTSLPPSSSFCFASVKFAKQSAAEALSSYRYSLVVSESVRVLVFRFRRPIEMVNMIGTTSVHPLATLMHRESPF
jgi:hypothetical protein